MMWRKWRAAEPPATPEMVTDADLAVRAAAARAGEAQRQLREARAREPRTRALARTARMQLARNGLGELFDEALGMGRGGAAR